MTGQEIFDLAVALLGEADNGECANYDLEGFEKSAVGILNVLGVSLDGLDCTLKRQRPDADNHRYMWIGSLKDPVPLHPVLCRSLLPLGLCYYFLLEENAARATHFLRAFESQKAAVEKRFPGARRHGIRNVYQ